MLINNMGIKSTNVLVTVRQGSFDAHGGIVGGYIDVSNLSAKGNFYLCIRSFVIYFVFLHLFLCYIYWVP